VQTDQAVMSENRVPSGTLIYTYSPASMSTSSGLP